MPLSRVEGLRFDPEVRRSETSVEIREITVGVKPFKRDAFPHREPHMSMSQFGYVTVDWFTPTRVAIRYYEVNSERPVNMLNAEYAVKKWVSRDADLSELSTFRDNLFVRRWSAMSTIQGDNPLLTIATKDLGGISLLKIKADSSS